ncbi:hypothetical protein CIK66_10535 [Brachybacterium alimentarium]|uniref:Uncharacterized protein n=1 Tax=Brachybacterium alimentarium TaxID=47845 RepID=A0A2A3YJ49_9MICO|nr:hypothetical protein [Brachybacterium alimentarium]PCC39115.1 hypothetical protein CIK66_10535 [Brachybacterium alimentarium]
MSGDGFSDTGLWVFLVTMLVMGGGLVLVVLGTALFARRHRFLKACGVFLGGAVLGAPVIIVAAVIGTSI